MIGLSFLDGYHQVLREPDPQALCRQLHSVEPNYQGFAVEGAAMATWLLDALSLFRRHRWETFFGNVAASHPYVAHVGVGWALARLPWHRRSPERALNRFDPLLQWLILDGYGFHEGYFHAAKWIRRPSNRPQFSKYANRVFDQGIGRSLWFVEGADVARIAETIDTFEIDRWPDLWSGVGLACAYAGQAAVPELDLLIAKAATNLPHLQQGVTFGAEARILGRIANEFTEQTCLVICGMSADSAAMLTRTSRNAVEEHAESMELPCYEQWRTRIRESFTEVPSTCI